MKEAELLKSAIAKEIKRLEGKIEGKKEEIKQAVEKETSHYIHDLQTTSEDIKLLQKEVETYYYTIVMINYYFKDTKGE